MNSVFVSTEGIEEPSWLGRVSSFCSAVLETLGKDGWTVSVVVCGDDFIRALNRDYRGKDEPTDVLSFAQKEVPSPDGVYPADDTFIAGDIVISLPAIGRNAQDFGVDPDEETKRLLVHGILHLDGRDHANNEPGDPMIDEQEKILNTLKEERIL